MIYWIRASGERLKLLGTECADALLGQSQRTRIQPVCTRADSQLFFWSTEYGVFECTVWIVDLVIFRWSWQSLKVCPVAPIILSLFLPLFRDKSPLETAIVARIIDAAIATLDASLEKLLCSLLSMDVLLIHPQHFLNCGLQTSLRTRFFLPFP